MRELTIAECEVVSGGHQWYCGSSCSVTELPPITVVGNPGGGGGYNPNPMDPGWGGGGGSGGTDPDCDKTNDVTVLEAPDGAKYYVPENVDGKYILDAINHLRAQANIVDRITEFNRMYTDPTHPHFIDFKDWGTANGPAGSVSGGTTTYWSSERGEYYTGSVFEAFGNYAYGFIGHVGGIPSDVLEYAAGHTQTGAPQYAQLLGFWADAPEDRPHVDKGIEDAKSYNLVPREMFGVNTQNCGG